MLQKTQGIVLNFIKYKETSVIVKIYTEKYGIQTYIENGVRSSKGKNKIALFQPLTILDLVVYHDHKKEIHRISEIKCIQPFVSIPYDIRKSSIAIFLNEILIKSLKEHEENLPLFDFILHSIQYLDHQKLNVENFHLNFLLSYCSYLGFAPENAEEIVNQLLHKAILVQNEGTVVNLINLLLKEGFGNSFAMTRQNRNEILEVLLLFYKIHLEGFTDIKSLTILKEILN